MNRPPTEEASAESPREMLRARIRMVSAAPTPPAAEVLTRKLAEKFPDAAVLFYGSGASVSGGDDPASLVFDFYVIGRSYKELYRSPFLRAANRLLPPNVFYIETPSSFGTLRAKYAVLSIDHFEKLVSQKTFHSYFWGRFAQPCRIIDPSGRLANRLENALADAVATFCKESLGLTAAPFAARDLWLAGLAASYAAELRAEDRTRAGKLIDSYGDWAEATTEAALRCSGIAARRTAPGTIDAAAPARLIPARLAWRLRAALGTVLSVLRLLKGAGTFEGGVDYIAWKIKRHAQVDLAVTPWERRHPFLAAPGLAIRYYRLRSSAPKREESSL